jgi:hypothetical protein
MNKFICKTIILMFGVFSTLFCQKWVSPNYSNHFLDYRDIGYPGVTEIPADNCRISALLTGFNGTVYGATSGKQSYLFLYDRYINKVKPLGKLPNTSGVHHTILQDSSNNIYIGGGLNLLDEIALTREIPGGHRQIENQLYKDVKAYHEGYEGGHLFKYSTQANDDRVYLPDDDAIIEDLGIVSSNNSIYALCMDNDNNIIYGITYPDAEFFSYDIGSKTIKNYGSLLSKFIFSGPERSWRTVPRALVCIDGGNVITSGDDGLIIVFDSKLQKFHSTDLRIPGEYWESWNYNGYPVVEQLIKDGDDTIWGSTSDGFIFKLDILNEKIVDLGKPRVSRRIRGMVLSPNRNLYMICGELGQPCKLFSYNTDAADGFINWSYISVDRSPYYSKRAYQFESMTVDEEGTIYIGESDRRGKLFLYLPGGKVFKGGLNIKNPR